MTVFMNLLLPYLGLKLLTSLMAESATIVGIYISISNSRIVIFTASIACKYPQIIAFKKIFKHFFVLHYKEDGYH